ncbi:hypothetical protein [Deinococcus peraridilitoris]|uniref:Uncharacterized protein n=1 Tax=Deinococcus peraridilitoris (strain DSM 19664 / LMG 22246 / CIP 109416 / KR-200) TaxID=937777 RepID=L0A6L9_DEIPD|nr:hypothetical protein [Deinococcus peraridilitoris]AFZ69528.1 hypothetical protein Deipe_4161 [Deinococcus peraridilitoris DSM 19664]
MDAHQPLIFSAGEWVVIEKKGRPWRLTTIESTSEGEVSVYGGYRYCALSGWRLDAEFQQGQRLAPITPERLDYLVLGQLQEALAKPPASPPSRAWLDQLSALASASLRLNGPSGVLRLPGPSA